MNPIAKMLIDMAKFYDQQLDARQLEMYVEVMGKFPISIVLKAGKDYVADVKNTRFPIPPHLILKRFLPQEPDAKDVGRELALRIRGAISTFGWMANEEARKHIGEAGWTIIQNLGGWVYLCEHLGADIQETTFFAQVRDAIESMYRLGQQGFDPMRPAIEQGARALKQEIEGDLTPMKAIPWLPKKEE